MLNNNRTVLLVIFVVSLLCACQPGELPDGTALITSDTTTVPPTIFPTPQASATARPGSSLRGAVRVWLDWEPSELESLNIVIRSFQEQYPEVTISVAYHSKDEMRPAVEAIGDGGNAPTVLFAPATWGPDLWQDGLILDLSDLEDGKLQPSVHPLAWEQVSYQGALLALPIEMKGVVLYRNRSIAEEPALTVAEWIEAASDLRDEQVIGMGLDLGFDFSTSQLIACGGTLFTESGEIGIDSPEGICWLNLLAALRQAGRGTLNSDDDLALFEAGQAAWLIDGSWNAERAANAIESANLFVDPWPIFSETGFRLTGYVWTENAYMLSGSTQGDIEASWVFVQYLLTPEAQLFLSDPRRAAHLPTLAGMELADSLQAQLLAAFSLGYSRPLRSDLELYIEPLEGAVVAVAMQGADPELAIEIALEKIDQVIPDVDPGE